MKLKIEIEMDNAAFGDGTAFDAGPEVATILRELASAFEREGAHERDLRDSNGNRVGAAMLTPKGKRK